MAIMKNIEKEMKLLRTHRVDINIQLNRYESNCYKPNPQALTWLENLEKAENEFEHLIQQSNAAAAAAASKSCIFFRRKTKTTPVDPALKNEINQLILTADHVLDALVLRVKRVELMTVPRSIEGLQNNLQRIGNLLIDDEFSVIGVWGMAGIGKTLLMKALNNALLNNASEFPHFDLVVFVTISLPLDLTKVQRQIAARLNVLMNDGDNLITGARKINKRLKEEKRPLIIFDDVWQAFDLVELGIPTPEDHAGCKVILTSRDMNVCTYICKNVELVKVNTLNDQESWRLFVNGAGDVANLEGIEPIARDIARECGGLPLAIQFLGKSMRNKIDIESWEYALESLRSWYEPNCSTVDVEVYKNIKRSYDFLSVYICGDIQKCFLYCSLFPKDCSIQIDALVQMWYEKGFFGYNKMEEYEKWHNLGVEFVKRLVNVSLLEQPCDDFVKMHAVVRVVARWIGKTWIAHDLIIL